MNDLTVLILVPNARDRIERCLESVRWADDIFCVVDPKCADGSDEVARGFIQLCRMHRSRMVRQVEGPRQVAGFAIAATFKKAPEIGRAHV